MDKFSGSDELYNELVEKSEDHWLLGLVAFAVIEEQRIEWAKHQAEYNGGVPTPEQIRQWYEQQPKGVLLRARDTAEARLKDYSDQIVELFMEEQRKEIEQSIIVSEIRDAKKFWPQFGVNLAGGFASALIFAVLLTIFAFLVVFDASPAEIGAKLREQTGITQNG